MSTNQPACPLHPRQIECVKLLAAGKTYAEIAIIMSVREEAVKTHLKRARLSAEVYNGPALVAKAIREGWIA